MKKNNAKSENIFFMNEIYIILYLCFDVEEFNRLFITYYLLSIYIFTIYYL